MFSIEEIFRILDYCRTNGISHIKIDKFEAVVGAPQVNLPSSELRSLTDEEVLTGYRENK